MSATGGALALGARGAAAQAVCVLVHGRGQSPEVMQAHVLARLSAPSAAFILPRAPTGAWYEGRAIEPKSAVTEAELAASIDHLARVLAAARTLHPGRPLLLAGFSQGACLCIEYCCLGLPAPEALVAFTGCRVGVATDARPEKLRSALPVYLSGGDADPWIPVGAFADAALSLGRAGAMLRADLFPGRGHEVSDPEIRMLEAMLADLVAGRRPGMGASR
ncbi:MAG: alpha/beta hydrolase [Bosea sp. (in: a-proteobacteria)]